MTKSTITREQLEEWVAQFDEDGGCDATDRQLEALIHQSLAAMDSEPVAEVVSIYGDPEAFGEREIRPLVGIQQMPYGTKLYRHAQQPVVPDDVRQALSKMDDEIIAELVAEESVCRAAMLPAAPVRSSMPDGVVTAEHRRVIEMLLSVCGAAFELADDSCQQDVDGEDCHVVPDDAFQKLSDALDEIENTLPTEDIDRPDVFLAWSAMPRAALKSLLQAQPVPVVPEEMTIMDACKFVQDMRLFDDVSVIVMRTWNACRAAMLQELKKSAGTEAICRSNENVQAVEVQSLTSINPAPDLVSLQKKAESIIGNYPGIPDCWCRTCRPVVLNDMRFVVCPDCGNKRCPRANNHRNACTGSNEPGQEGSAYPASPQSPGSEPATVPGKWIPVSERMPEVGEIVLAAMGGAVIVSETECTATGLRFFTSVISGRELPATHWMPLPAVPQEVR